MSKTRIAALMAATLVLGLVLGGVVSSGAAPAPQSGAANAEATYGGFGLRLGSAMRDAGGRLADVVAKLTGLDVDDVVAKRAAGDSFADIAESKGIKADDVVDAAVDVREDILAERVKAGDITQEQADAALDRMTTRLTERVDSTDASCDGSGGGRGGMGGGMGRGRGGSGGGCGGACIQTPTATQ